MSKDYNDVRKEEIEEIIPVIESTIEHLVKLHDLNFGTIDHQFYINRLEELKTEYFERTGKKYNNGHESRK